jgi:chemotaxis phosphatase CheX-like protein
MAKSIAARMLSVASPDPDDVVDAVAEIANIAGGNVKTLLSQHSRLSLPTSRIIDPPAELDDVGPLPGAAQVRAVMVGQIAQLAVIPGADPAGLLWPPSDSDFDSDEEPAGPSATYDHDDPGRPL